jgi:Spy/CpxP family protein refolding chaperone
MKRSIATMILSFGAAAMLAVPAFAQRPGGGFGGMGGGGGLGLLSNPGVQKELKLESDQTSKVEAIATSIREKHSNDFAKLRDLEGQERQEKAAELNKSVTSEVNKALADVLKPDQVKRFNQIRIQVQGLQAFADPDVQAKLNLDADQKQKIRSIAQDSQGQMREVFQSAGDDRAGARRKLAELRKENMDKALAVLTADQKSTWKDLTGEPFEVQFQGGPGGGRRPN